MRKVHELLFDSEENREGLHVILDQLNRIDRRPMSLNLVRTGNIGVQMMVLREDTDIGVRSAKDKQRFQRLAVECANRSV